MAGLVPRQSGAFGTRRATAFTIDPAAEPNRCFGRLEVVRTEIWPDKLTINCPGRFEIPKPRQTRRTLILRVAEFPGGDAEHGGGEQE